MLRRHPNARSALPRVTSLIALLLALSATAATASEALLSRGGCIGCHRIGENLMGPPLREVAARYRNDPDAATILFDKVREGGEGAWGDIPMPPKSPEQFSDEDLHAVIQWILQLQ